MRVKIYLSVKSNSSPSKRNRLLATVGAVAMAAMSSTMMTDKAFAQEEPSVEQVVVSSTRIVRDGYSAPTPTTVVAADAIQNAAEPNIFNVISQLPSLAGSTSTQTGNGGSSGGTNGLSTLNLRGLNNNRTLVLLDGERVVGSTLTGVNDISAFPQALIERVDVVTGGASASWGSDAVAGVVNFVVNKKFDGFKLNVQGGQTTYGDDQNGVIQAAGGTGFDGDRGHIEMAAEFATDAGIQHAFNRPWYVGSKVLTRSIAGTPAGTPQYIVANHVSDIQIAPGGIITAGPLQNTTFGPGGAPSQLQLGSPIISPFMVGGDQRSDIGGYAALAASLTRGTLYGRVSYQLTPDIDVFATVNYAEVHTQNYGDPQYKTASLTVQCDNAFLPTAVTAACASNKITNFQFGTYNADIGSFVVDNMRTQRRYVVGADGAFSFFDSDWTWDAYFEHGENDVTNTIRNQGITPLYNQAIDAVRDPTTGNIVCRSAAARAQGCLPLNVFGTGVANRSAINWVTGTPYLVTAQRQEAGGVTFNGEPFSDWAGKISVATGIEYREEGFGQYADAISQGNGGNPLLSAAGNNWFSGNFHASRGTYHVIEGFLETVVPLLKDAQFGDADLNLAARATNYSTAGYVTTWKVGATYAPAFLDGVRFRALQSRDVRAPNLSELYTAPQVFTQTVIDDFGPSAGKTFTIQRPQVGNLNLTPEKSQTTEVGMVLQPDWFPGFSTSVDYYRIGVKSAIGTLTNQQEMDLCFQGNQDLCGLITFNANQEPTSLTVQSINLASVVTDGFDVENSYQANVADWLPGLEGMLGLRSLLTHTSKFITNPGIPNQPLLESAGQNSGAIALWRWNGNESFTADRYTFTLNENYVSPGVISTAYVQCTTGCPLPTVNNPTINNNHIAGAFYVDVGGSYKITGKDYPVQSEIYFKIDNIANVDPPSSPGNGSLALINPGVNPSLYDTLGRMYRIGFRVSN